MSKRSRLADQPKYGVDTKIPTWATLVGMSPLTTAQPFLPEYSHEYGCYTILSLVTIYMHCYSMSYDFYALFPHLVVFQWLWMLTSIFFHQSSFFFFGNLDETTVNAVLFSPWKLPKKTYTFLSVDFFSSWKPQFYSWSYRIPNRKNKYSVN